MSSEWWPTVTQAHIHTLSRLWGDRKEMLRSFVTRRYFRRIAEVGVAMGGLSQFLIDEFNPTEFHAFDTFEMKREWLEKWGLPKDAPESSHLVAYMDAMTVFMMDRGMREESVQIHCGKSWERMTMLSPMAFDLIYIDGDHSYEAVKRDIEASIPCLLADGFLVFNDYTVREGYGIVPAVNELLAAGGWEIVAFALQQEMYCDIALRRST